MTVDKLRECFSRSLGIPVERVTDDLAYNTIKEWDSVGHMALVAELESGFDVMFDTDDILGVVGNTYVPVQTREAFAFLDSIVADGALR